MVNRMVKVTSYGQVLHITKDSLKTANRMEKEYLHQLMEIVNIKDIALSSPAAKKGGKIKADTLKENELITSCTALTYKFVEPPPAPPPDDKKKTPPPPAPEKASCADRAMSQTFEASRRWTAVDRSSAKPSSRAA